MSLVKSFTANGVLSGKQNVVFGISVSSFVDPASPPPPAGPLLITVRDDAAVSGTGNILARFTIIQDGGSDSVMFPAGVRCTNGVAITITQPTPEGHGDIVVVIDYS